MAAGRRVRQAPASGPTPGSGAPFVVQRRGIAPWIIPTSIGAILYVVGLAGWGCYRLWMAGPGGDIAFAQYNQAGNDASSSHDYITANNDYAQMIALRPHKVDGYLLRGINENKAGEYTDAIANFTSGLATTSLHVNRADLLFNRAWAEGSSGRTKAAIADYNQSNGEFALGGDPCCSSTVAERQMKGNVNLSLLYRQVKDYPDAVKTTTALISAGQGDYRMYAVRGEAELALSHINPAKFDMIQAFKLNPDDKYTLRDIGQEVEQTHQYGVGVAAYEEAVRDDPSNALAWGCLGWTQYQAGQLAQGDRPSARQCRLVPFDEAAGRASSG